MPTTVREMVMAAQQLVPSLTPAEVIQKLEGGEPVVIMDVRERDEYEQGHIEGATLLPRGLLEFRIDQVIPDRGTTIILH
jgi:rhodanese-related sulfurtransferase